MRTVENLEDLKNSIIKSNEVSVVFFCGDSCPPCKRVEILLKDIESSFNGRIKFLKITPKNSMAAFSKWAITSVPTVMFASKEPFADSIHVHAKIHLSSINRGNILGLLGEYMKNPMLR